MICNKTDNYRFVNDFFIKEFKLNLSLHQTNSVIKAAFALYKREGGPALKSLKIEEINTEHQEKFIGAIKKVLVSPGSPWKPGVAIQSENEKLFFNLIRGIMPPLSEFFKNPVLLKAVLWKKDKAILAEAKTLLQKIFEDIFKNIQERPLSPEESFHFEVIIGDLLALFPFLRPQDGSLLKVPMKLNGTWQMVEYQVQELPLTPKWLGSPYTAYGLISKNISFPPLLLYKGTTYPTDKGFLLSLLTDINPISSIGSYIFKLSRKKIEKWLEIQTRQGSNKAIIYGKSLGGAQAWRTGINFPQYVSKVMAYGAPGFSTFALKKIKENSNILPEINFLSQTNDLVPLFDEISFHKNVHYYEVSSSSCKEGLNAHAHMYSTHESSTILKQTEIKRTFSNKRFFISFAHELVSLVAFPIFLTIYLTYNSVKQIKKFTFKQIFRLTSGICNAGSKLFYKAPC